MYRACLLDIPRQIGQPNIGFHSGQSHGGAPLIDIFFLIYIVYLYFQEKPVTQKNQPTVFQN